MATDHIIIETIEGKFPTIFIPWKVKKKIDYIVNAVSTEIAWIGEAERLPNGDYIVNKIIIPSQEVDSSTTEVSPESIYEMSINLPKEEFDMDKFRYHGHSHGNIQSVDPSHQDDIQNRTFSEGCDWFIGTIHNRKNKTFGFVLDKTKNLYLKNVDVVILEPEPVQILLREIDQLNSKIKKIYGELIRGIDDSTLKADIAKKVINLNNKPGILNNKPGTQIPNYNPKYFRYYGEFNREIEDKIAEDMFYDDESDYLEEFDDEFDGHWGRHRLPEEKPPSKIINNPNRRK